ncbi:MAG: hypothetical protein LBB76_04935 [Azoarcus sp.]|nr:hypothetical protein [Azoarcus sp.]
MPDTESPQKPPLPGLWDKNPFAAPATPVEDVPSSDRLALAADPNKLAAGRGLAWWREGWHLFKDAPGLWIGISLMVIFINIGFARVSIPFVGKEVYTLFFPVLNAGLMLGCHDLQSGEGLRFGHLFAGFRNHVDRLLMIGAVNIAGILAIGIMADTLGATRPGIILLGILLSIPLAMIIWFAPALIVLHDLTALKAMKLSFRGCLRNILPFLMYGLVFIFVFVMLVFLPFGLATLFKKYMLLLALGWAILILMLMSIFFCSIHVGYRDIFIGKH